MRPQHDRLWQMVAPILAKAGMSGDWRLLQITSAFCRKPTKLSSNRTDRCTIRRIIARRRGWHGGWLLIVWIHWYATYGALFLRLSQAASAVQLPHNPARK